MPKIICSLVMGKISLILNLIPKISKKKVYLSWQNLNSQKCAGTKHLTKLVFDLCSTEVLHVLWGGDRDRVYAN